MDSFGEIIEQLLKAAFWIAVVAVCAALCVGVSIGLAWR